MYVSNLHANRSVAQNDKYYYCNGYCSSNTGYQQGTIPYYRMITRAKNGPLFHYRSVSDNKRAMLLKGTQCDHIVQ